ncbi:PREDICTED: glutamine--tRNA ligase, cytoplasmic-like isoform X1 [Camelina sativa]|uniref:glutamine--tRNA ligase n=1 Tax=Camelina sativa TaxID=90675 RepID=A0ABM1QG78_CAMSA|nr:PREDICTED: glutamine--tRNA ligase, cytoplasmic-like isoform X1 [Camelina sativa]
MVHKDDNPLELFRKISLDERTVKNTIGNSSKITSDLIAVIHQAGVSGGCDRTIGYLLHTVATTYYGKALVHRPTLLNYIASSKIKTRAQLDAAYSFLDNKDFNLTEFEEACGVGVEVSLADIEEIVEHIFQQNLTTILALRYRTNVGEYIGHVLRYLPWADPSTVKTVIEAKMFELLGPRTAADNVKPPRVEEVSPGFLSFSMYLLLSVASPSEYELNPYSRFPQPGKNFLAHTKVLFSDGSVLRCKNTKELLHKHLKVTGGKVYTRFPFEPNGYWSFINLLYFQAMFANFGLAKNRGGCCYLRYDDTNPEAEKKEHINHIEEIVKWMGWEPFKITYTSDYFQELYNFAVELIQTGHAYVDHQNAEEIKEYREKKINSPWRERPIEESLMLFDEMRRGLIEEGHATLRMKQDMQNDNYNMFDLIAYHIKFTPHPHARDKWCIYPTNDFAHCIVDSLENITHSLCTLEFETRRASYYWLLHSLGLYMPYVWEYSRLNVTNTVMSKRKLNYVVTNKYVDGWDDPRLLTLAGLRRRGVTPTSINAFIRGLGITRSDGSMIHVSRLEHHIREELNITAPRTMVVLNPLKVVITNMEPGKVIEIDAEKWPDTGRNDPSAFYKVPFSRVVYIEQSDFRKEDSKNYYGLAPGKSVRLRYAFQIKCTNVVFADDKETVREIHAVYYPELKTKLKGALHWVAASSPGKEEPLKVEVRLFEKLFNSENPAELGDGWLTDINPNSKVVVSDAYALSTIKDAVVGDTFQFERLGYFAVDKSSTPGKLVFNRTVRLGDRKTKRQM